MCWALFFFCVIYSTFSLECLSCYVFHNIHVFTTAIRIWFTWTKVRDNDALSKATFRWLIRCLFAILRALPCITTYHYAQLVLPEFIDRQMVSCLQPTRLYYFSSHHEKEVRTLMFRHFYTLHISNTLHWNPYLSWYHICAYCFILFIKQT